MRSVLKIAAVVAALIVGGFFWFVEGLTPASPATRELRPADGVVVFTGAGGERVSTAMSLLANGAASRLLISGVNPDTDRSEIAAFWPGDRADFECCVDLGRVALSTQGNAREVREWALDHSFDDLILVTSDYHMPRALLELRAALPDAAVTAYPVSSVFLNAAGRPASAKAWRVLAVEYLKFLAVRVKTFR